MHIYMAQPRSPPHTALSRTQRRAPVAPPQCTSADAIRMLPQGIFGHPRATDQELVPQGISGAIDARSRREAGELHPCLLSSARALTPMHYA